jgi:hypothetical protein
MDPEAPLVVARRRYAEVLAAKAQHDARRPASDDHLALTAWTVFAQRFTAQHEADEARWRELHAEAETALHAMVIERAAAHQGGPDSAAHQAKADEAEATVRRLCGGPDETRTLVEVARQALQSPEGVG